MITRINICFSRGNRPEHVVKLFSFLKPKSRNTIEGNVMFSSENLTLLQIKAIVRKFEQENQDISFKEFTKTVQLTIGMDDAVVFKCNNIWLVVETDGYMHS